VSDEGGNARGEKNTSSEFFFVVVFFFVGLNSRNSRVSCAAAEALFHRLSRAGQASRRHGPHSLTSMWRTSPFLAATGARRMTRAAAGAVPTTRGAAGAKGEARRASRAADIFVGIVLSLG